MGYTGIEHRSASVVDVFDYYPTLSNTGPSVASDRPALGRGGAVNCRAMAIALLPSLRGEISKRLFRILFRMFYHRSDLSGQLCEVLPFTNDRFLIWTGVSKANVAFFGPC